MTSDPVNTYLPCSRARERRNTCGAHIRELEIVVIPLLRSQHGRSAGAQDA